MSTYNVSGVTVVDADSQRSWRKASEPGELYARLQLRAVEVVDGPHAGKFVIVNETGRDGAADFIDTEFGYFDSIDAAMRRIDRAMASQL